MTYTPDQMVRYRAALTGGGQSNGHLLLRALYVAYVCNSRKSPRMIADKIKINLRNGIYRSYSSKAFGDKFDSSLCAVDPQHRTTILQDDEVHPRWKALAINVADVSISADFKRWIQES